MNTDLIDVFVKTHDLDHLNESEKIRLLNLLQSHYPLVLQGGKIRTREEIPDHNKYMKLAAILGKIGYRKQGIWFIPQVRK